MTFLQFLNSLFYLIIYPIVMRSLGAENYGKYVFSLSIVTYFIVFISFGFDLPALNKISKFKDDVDQKSRIFSEVFYSKLCLFLLSTTVFFILIICISALRDIQKLLLILYLQVILNILMPNWYYQGIQKMDVLTYIQVAFKLLSLPFIYILVRAINDLFFFALIITLSSLFTGLTSLIYLRVKEKIKIKIVAFSEIKACINESLPFFWSSSAGIVRVQGTNTIIGLFIGMNGLAIYDLASKIILLPQAIAMNINNALFPSIVNADKIRKDVVQKILKYETFFGLFIVLMVALLGRQVINWLGGTELMNAYMVAVVLSTTILTWISVSCYIYFLFLPNGLHKTITYNQFWAFGVFFSLAFLGLHIEKSVIMIAFAAAISGFAEVFYCRIIIKRHNLL